MAGWSPHGAETQLLVQRLHGLEQACLEAHHLSPAQNRAPGGVTLIAASKRQPVQKLMALYDAGHRDFGENYVQELQSKAQAMQASGRHPRWHLIGPLQRNKVNGISALNPTVHAVDGLPLAQKIAHRAQALGHTAQVFVQVRDGDAAASRAGVDPGEALTLARAILALPHIRLMGLMVLPWPTSVPQQVFARLRVLRGQVQRLPLGNQAVHLSMGMSHDFRAAIHEGATMVRVGSALFGPRP